MASRGRGRRRLGTGLIVPGVHARGQQRRNASFTRPCPWPCHGDLNATPPSRASPARTAGDRARGPRPRMASGRRRPHRCGARRRSRRCRDPRGLARRRLALADRQGLARPGARDPGHRPLGSRHPPPAGSADPARGRRPGHRSRGDGRRRGAEPRLRDDPGASRPPARARHASPRCRRSSWPRRLRCRPAWRCSASAGICGAGAAERSSPPSRCSSLLAGLDLLKGLDVEEAAITLALAGGLWRARAGFHVRHDGRLPRAGGGPRERGAGGDVRAGDGLAGQLAGSVAALGILSGGGVVALAALAFAAPPTRRRLHRP